MDDRRIGGKIKRLRECAGFEQTELAERARVSPSYVSRLERGQSDPKLSDLQAVAAALDVTIAELVGEDRAMIGERLAETVEDPELRLFLVRIVSGLRNRSEADMEFVRKAFAAIADRFGDDED